MTVDLPPLKSQTVSHRPRASLVLNVKDPFHMDFGFFNVPSFAVSNPFWSSLEAVTSLYMGLPSSGNKNPPSPRTGFGFVNI
jgi:hypothetical protein